MMGQVDDLYMIEFSPDEWEMGNGAFHFQTLSGRLRRNREGLLMSGTRLTRSRWIAIDVCPLEDVQKVMRSFSHDYRAKHGPLEPTFVIRHQNGTRW